jgi:exonuclease VII small subunit
MAQDNSSYYLNQSYQLEQQQLALESANYQLNAQNQYWQQQDAIETGLLELAGERNQNQIDIWDAEAQIASYDAWLGNYENLKAAELGQVKSQGQAAYETLMSALGQADAVAGATGRVGAGQSMNYAGGMLKQKVVDYAGEDMRLNAVYGADGKLDERLSGQYGLVYDQKALDLEWQRASAEGQVGVLNKALALYNQNISLYDQREASLKAAQSSMGSLESWISQLAYTPAETEQKGFLAAPEGKLFYPSSGDGPGVISIDGGVSSGAAFGPAFSLAGITV